MGEGHDMMRNQRGVQGEHNLIIFEAIEFRGGEKQNEIDAFTK
jgi:hypothetical protein